MKALFLLAVTTFAGIAAAQTPPPPPPGPPPPPMKHHGMGQDANRDGVITRQEALDAAGKRFDRMDTNHDGKLDANEMQASRQMRQMRGIGGGYGRGGDMPPPPPPPGTPDGE